MLTSATLARVTRRERELEETNAMLAALERSILAKAFRGELVPQDPADEPADAMLARLRSEPSATDAGPEAPAQRTSRRKRKVG